MGGESTSWTGKRLGAFSLDQKEGFVEEEEYKHDLESCRSSQESPVNVEDQPEQGLGECGDRREFPRLRPAGILAHMALPVSSCPLAG